MKKMLGLVLALSLGMSSCVMAEDIVLTGFGPGLTLIGDPADETLRRVFDYAEENARYVKTALVAEGRYAPIRAYKLEWPAQRGPVNQRVATEYVKYDIIVAVQYEIESYSSPFTNFKYLAVGIDSNGNIEPCATPDKIISMTYDPQSFKDFRITAYKFEGVERSAIAVYLPDENYDGLEKFEAEGVNSAAGLIEALEKGKAVPTGTHVLSYDGKTLDLSEEFGESMSRTGTAGEYLMMGAVVNTFIDNLGLTELSVTSAGKTIETGHAVYDEPLKYYESNKG